MNDFIVDISDPVFTFALADYPGPTLNPVVDLVEETSITNLSTPTVSTAMTVEEILALRAAGEAAGNDSR